MKTMTCEQARETWLLAGDEALPPRRQRALQAHLEGCSACRFWTADAGRWSDRQRAATPDWPLAEGTRTVLRIAATRLRGRSVRWGPRHPFSIPALAAAVLVFAGLTAWMLLRPAAPAGMAGTPVDGWGGHPGVAEMTALAYLLHPDDAADDGADGWPTPVDGGDALDALAQWILQVQAGETLAYLDDRLAAAF